MAKVLIGQYRIYFGELVLTVSSFTFEFIFMKLRLLLTKLTV